MSEQVKAALQEKMKDAPKDLRVSFLPVYLGTVFITYGVIDLTVALCS